VKYREVFVENYNVGTIRELSVFKCVFQKNDRSRPIPTKEKKQVKIVKYREVFVEKCGK
jgi:hypothetical protein